MAEGYSRRDFIKILGAGSLALPGIIITTVKTKSQNPPNIIFIITDDQRWDTLGVMGNNIIKTPNMDKLSNDGVLFNNTYVTTSICCSSRASMLTGQYTSRHKVNSFYNDLSDKAIQSTYPLLLKKAGYKIGFVGKYGVGLKKRPKQYFDYWTCPEIDQPEYITKDENGNFIHDTDKCGNETLKFLDKYYDKGPFCLSISFKAPHCLDGAPAGKEFVYQSRYKDLYKEIIFIEPETAKPEYWNSFPEFFKIDNEARIRWKKRFSTNELFQTTMKGYYRLISGVDDVLGNIMNKLTELKIEKNTVIIFTGDNGFYLDEHEMAGKWYGHEPSIRVPLFIYDPRIPQNQRGKKVDQIALNIDIAPTILSLAGIDIPLGMQGKNLLRLLNNNKDWRIQFFYEETVDIKTIPKSEGIIAPPFKYLVFTESDPKYEWFYDNTKDNLEKVNLAYDPDYQVLLHKYREEYKKMKEAVL